MLGILRGHRAGLRIISAPGQGSIFRLYFPAAQAEALAQPALTPEPKAETLRGRVLVVDDEELILESTGAVLCAMGFEVFTARDGIEALAMVEARRGELDLVLMDMTMPRMDGLEAFLAMRGLDPKLPVILSSGFTEQDSLQAFGGESPAAFIQKPYQLKELRKIIQGVLGET
jgi:CheY-like chemotaxis protein